MSGVKVGTRLEQLRVLERAARHQLASAERREDPAEVVRHRDLLGRVHAAITEEERVTRARPTVAAGVRDFDATVQGRLAALGVTAREVKQWAVEAGADTCRRPRSDQRDAGRRLRRPPAMSDHVTTDEAAAALKVPASVVAKWKHARKVTPVGMLRGRGRGGKVPLYRLADLQPLAEAYHQRATTRREGA